MQHLLDVFAKIIDPRPWAPPMSWPKEWDHQQDVDHAKMIARHKAQQILSIVANYQDGSNIYDQRHLSL